MNDPVVVDRVKEFLLPALEEAFTKVSGIFLDRGTSLLETLAGVTAEEASRAPAPGQATLAAQVEHVAFYLDVLERGWNGEEVGKVDWKEIWNRRRGVAPAEWDVLRERLRASYERIAARAGAQEDWASEEHLSAPFAILVHTAYHLGGLRMALGTLRAAAPKRT